MRRLALVLALPLLAVACGGGGKSTPSTAAARDPGAETMRALIAAASKGDPAAIWSHLSTASQKRLGIRTVTSSSAPSRASLFLAATSIEH